jgi:hypothetical protein
MTPAERIASAFHAAYEALAPSAGYETRKESAVPWTEVPAANRALMIATVEALLSGGVIQPGGPAPHSRLGTNSGHGHVWQRPDGARARCGGPGICTECSRDQAVVGGPR